MRFVCFRLTMLRNRKSLIVLFSGTLVAFFALMFAYYRTRNLTVDVYYISSPSLLPGKEVSSAFHHTCLFVLPLASFLCGIVGAWGVFLDDLANGTIKNVWQAQPRRRAFYRNAVALFSMVALCFCFLMWICSLVICSPLLAIEAVEGGVMRSFWQVLIAAILRSFLGGALTLFLGLLLRATALPVVFSMALFIVPYVYISAHGGGFEQISNIAARFPIGGLAILPRVGGGPWFLFSIAGHAFAALILFAFSGVVYERTEIW